ncbi:uncharacterized protein LOC8043912 [Ixodes scapularis]|uniref:uncharacterized protein LOC8043912 n=1 Tax=Ixodes scapularis TaxID=6945 RepID=UPI001C3948FF|nr:uncharacterized protein LOC8043912 [Ixodes scapularis]
MDVGVRYGDPDSATEQGGGTSASGGQTASNQGHHREGASVSETSPSARPLEEDVFQHGPGDPHDTTAIRAAYEKPYSFSAGAIPTEVSTREKKRSSTKNQSAHVEAYYDADGYGSGGPQESLPRPYPPQSKSYGHAPKEISRSMGTTTLPREDPIGYAMETAMAKGDTGRQIRRDYRGSSMAHGMSRSLPKQSFFLMEDQEGLQYPSRSAICLQEMPLQQVDAYYSPQLYRKGDYFAKLSSSSSFKPKRHDNKYYEQFVGEPAMLHQQQQQQLAYDEAEYRKQWTSAATGYPGNQRWAYDLPYQGQQYAVHVVQETGHNDVFREGGDTGIVKSSGDSSSKFAAAATQEDASGMYVYVRDAQTGTDTPLPSSVIGGSPPIPAPVRLPEVTKQASGSSSSSSTSSEEQSSSESSSSSASLNEAEGGEPAAALLPTAEYPPIHQKPVQEVIQQQPIQQSMQQPLQQPIHQPVQEPMQHPIQQHMQQPTQHLAQHPMHQMIQHQPTAQEYAAYQEAYQQFLHRQRQQQAYQQAYSQAQQMPIQHGQSSQSLGQEKKKVYFACSPEAATEVCIRTPAEGASLRSFQSRSSADVASVENAGEESRSLVSSNTNMVTPLLRPLLPRKALPPGKDKMENLCLALNVILFSVLAGVVAAFIVQQVSHAI